jgi:FdhD protein
LSVKKKTKSYQALRSKRGIYETSSLEFIGEEPLSIRIEDKSYSVVMRTPGEELFHAAGLCLGEGIVDEPGDFETIRYDENQDPNVIDIWLKTERRKKIQNLLERRSFVSQTSCGICGKKMIRDLHQIVTPVESDFEVQIDTIFDCINKLSEKQTHYQTTRGSHAALIFSDQLEIISFAEDVGRHNALDKAIGKAFMDRKLLKARLLVLSSRISYELVQKAARAHLPIIISESRPTALAVEMGNTLNMTLAFSDEGSELVIVCDKNRIKKPMAWGSY